MVFSKCVKTLFAGATGTSKLRSSNYGNCYNRSLTLLTNMQRDILLWDIEEDQELNPELTEMLIEVVEVLPNLEA